MNIGTQKGYHKGCFGSTKASKAWETKKQILKRNLRNSMNAAYRRGNTFLGNSRKAQLSKL